MAEPAEAFDKAVRLGNYQLIAKMGKGGMSTVYLAKVDGLAGFNKLAVLKVLRSDLAHSKEFVDMFFNEARLAARLTHPNIVHTYGAGEDQGRLYIAMEYLDGIPWSRVRRRLTSRKTLPLNVHLKVLAETLAGLHYAHELRDFDDAPLQVVHCDVSPQNVFVTHDGQVKVVDFGVARAVNYSKMQTGSIFLGRPAYCSPEQARGEALDRRADVFSVGVMLWEALAGRRFVNSKDIAETLRRRSVGEEPRIRDVVPDVSSALAEICDRALQLAPQDRFATAADFRKQLQGYLTAHLTEVDETLIAEMIAEPFQEERQRVHTLIEQRINRPNSPAKSVDKLFEPDPQDSSENTLKADLSELASVSKLKDDKAVVEASVAAMIRPAKTEVRRWQIAAAVAGSLALIAGIVLWRTLATPTIYVSPVVTPRSGAANVAATPTPSVQPATVAAASEKTPFNPASSGPTVQLTITATPSEATIYLDGTPLPSNPFTQKLLKENKLRSIRAMAEGFAGEERVLALDRDRVVNFQLATTSTSNNRLRSRSPSYAPSRKRKDETRSEPTPQVPEDVAPAASVSPARTETTVADPRVGVSSPPEQTNKNNSGRTAPSSGKMDFDDRIVPSAAPVRKIFEEDPY